MSNLYNKIKFCVKERASLNNKEKAIQMRIIYVTKEFYERAEKDLKAEKVELNKMMLAAKQFDGAEEIKSQREFKQKRYNDNAMRFSSFVPYNIRTVDLSNVAINTIVEVSETNLKTKETVVKNITICPLGGQNYSQNVFNYNSPAIAPLIGRQKGDIITIKTPTATNTYKILKIKKMQKTK